MSLTTVYVTVGTTKFDALIQEVTGDKVLRALKKRGCSKLVLQIGTGHPVDACLISNEHNILVEQYDFKYDSVRSDIINADFIIGHAGAGTCMDILNNRKAGVVVVNQGLMNNHQLELAEQLKRERYLYFCSVEQLGHELETLELGTLKPYESRAENMHRFVEHLNGLVAS